MDSSMMRRWCRHLSYTLILCLVALTAETLWIRIIDAQVAGSVTVFLLEDFSKAEVDGFPQGWHASRSETITRQAYQIQQDNLVRAQDNHRIIAELCHTDSAVIDYAMEPF